MADDPGRRLSFLERLLSMPADLATVALFVLATDFVVLAPVIRTTPLRIVFGLPFVLFVPGYAFIAALFPEGGQPVSVGGTSGSREGKKTTDQGRGIDVIERVALSFGSSIAIVALIGLGLNFTPWGIGLPSILIALNVFTLTTISFGAIRRSKLPVDERFRVPYGEVMHKARTELAKPNGRTEAVLNVLLVVSVLLALGSVTYALAVPKAGEPFTEFYLLTEDENGTPVATNYPTEFVRGEPRTLIVGVDNHEQETVNYTVVIELQRVRVTNDSVTILEEREMKRFRARLSDNETWQHRHAITPTLTGERLRLAYMLYKGDPPPEPSIVGAYRETHLWVNVSKKT